MISDALQKNKVLNDPSVITQSAKEELCSVFFLGYVIYACVKYLKWIGMGVLTLITVGMVVWNRMRIVREEREAK